MRSLRRLSPARVAAALTLTALVPALVSCGRPAGSASATDVAWVATGARQTEPGTDVVPVDLSARRVEAPVPVGSLPSALAYTPDDAGLLVVTQGDDTLHEIDPATHNVVRTLGVGVEPDAVAVAPGGTGGKGLALVANFDSDTVTPVDLGTWRAEPPIPVGSQPVAIAVAATLGGALAFVADFGSAAVTPIDLTTRTPEPPIPVGPGPQAVAAAAGEVLVASFGNHMLTPISVGTRTAGPAVTLPFNPTAMEAAHSGTVYVAGGAGVVPVSVPSLVVGAAATLPGVVQDLALTSDGTTAWVTLPSGSIVPVRLADRAIGAPVRLSGHPTAIVIGAG